MVCRITEIYKKTRTHLRGELEKDCQGQNLIIQTEGENKMRTPDLILSPLK